MRKRIVKKVMSSRYKTGKVVISSKMIKPTIIKDREIIKDIICEAMRTPNKKAIDRNKSASEYLKKMRG